MGYRISAVSYLNTKPFLSGLYQSNIPDDHQIVIENPAECAESVFNGKSDIGLIPTAVLADLPDFKIISPFGIACSGAVGTVLLLGQEPIENWDRVYLDYQSRTSVGLTKILFEEFWKRDVEFIHTESGYESKTYSPNSGVLIIGDRSIYEKPRFKYCYDLGAEWQKFTGLPFVFACWVSLKQIESNFQNNFNRALKNGVLNLKQQIDQWIQEPWEKESVLDYFDHKLEFEIDDKKLNSIELFLSKLTKKSYSLEGKLAYLTSIL